jgi:ribosomal protein S18 acetylase RimI-like enzyme
MIRRATEADVDAIGALWEKLALYHCALDPELPQPAEKGGQLYAQRIHSRLNDHHTRVLVAEIDQRVVGFVLGVLVDYVPEMFQQQMGGFLADIYVDEPYRTRGIGRALVDQLAEWFRAHDVDYFEWYVAANNPTARAFWAAQGGRDLMIRMRTRLDP